MSQDLKPTRTDLRHGRQQRALALAADQDGVVHREQLRALGITRHHVRVETAAGRWATVGRQTVAIPASSCSQQAQFRASLWESGKDSALDGVAALVAAGLANYDLDVIDVSIPHRVARKRIPGVRHHRRRIMPKILLASIRRVHPALALINAGAWAKSDRQAALIIAMALQQKLVNPEHVLWAWARTGRVRRRAFLEMTIKDACDGAHSLDELNFARLCRRYGLPQPDRQVVRRSATGRIYLDVCWQHIGLVVEIDGGHHGLTLQPIDDALRQNDVVIGGSRVLRIPVLGLRIHEEAFMHQVLRAYISMSATS